MVVEASGDGNDTLNLLEALPTIVDQLTHLLVAPEAQIGTDDIDGGRVCESTIVAFCASCDPETIAARHIKRQIQLIFCLIVRTDFPDDFTLGDHL